MSTMDEQGYDAGREPGRVEGEPRGPRAARMGAGPAEPAGGDGGGRTGVEPDRRVPEGGAGDPGAADLGGIATGPRYEDTAAEPRYDETAAEPRYEGTASEPRYEGTAAEPRYDDTAAGDAWSADTTAPETRGSTAPAVDYGVTAPEEGYDEAAPEAGYEQAPAGHDETGPARLIPPDRSADYQQRWEAVKAQFVDEPRRAVREADQLVGEVLDEIEAMFRHQRGELERDLHDDTATTEDLRLALGRYRSFFDRLLSF